MKIQWIPTALIDADPSYQRDIDRAAVRRIAREYSERLFGALDVSARPDGRYAVFDGQHRLVAARLLGLETVPCMVHDGMSVTDEAAAFFGVNTARKAVSPSDRFRAAVRAGREPEVYINMWLTGEGVSVASHDGPTAIDFPVGLLRCWTSDPAACRRALRSHRDALVDGDELRGVVFEGLHYLETRGVDTAPLAKRLRAAGGMTRLIQAVRAGRGTDVGRVRAAARAILAVANRGLRAKTPMPEE